MFSLYFFFLKVPLLLILTCFHLNKVVGSGVQRLSSCRMGLVHRPKSRLAGICERGYECVIALVFTPTSTLRTEYILWNPEVSLDPDFYPSIIGTSSSPLMSSMETLLLYIGLWPPIGLCLSLSLGFRTKALAGYFVATCCVPFWQSDSG